MSAIARNLMTLWVSGWTLAALTACLRAWAGEGLARCRSGVAGGRACR